MTAFILLLALAAQVPRTLEEIDAALAKEPGSVVLLKAKGRLLLQDRTRSAQARTPLEKAVKLAPGDPEAHYYLAQWACLHNADRQCLVEARAALQLAPSNDNASLQLNTLIGIAAEKLAQSEDAEKAFIAALEANRRLGLKDPLAVFQYIDFLNKRARDDDAQLLVQLLMDKAPAFGPAFLEQAKFFARKGDKAKAVETAEYSLKLRWMDKEKQRAAHVLLARTYFQLGNEAEARRHQEWVESNP